MNLPVTAAGTAPAPEPTPQPVEAAVPAPAPAPAPQQNQPKVDVKTLMASLTPEQRAAAARGDFASIRLTPEQRAAMPPIVQPTTEPKAPVEPAAAEPQPTPTPSQPQEPQPTPAAPSNAALEGTDPDAGEDPAASKSKRFRFSAEEDLAVLQIAKSKGISVVEAAKIYAGNPAVPAPATPQAPAAAPEVETPDPVIGEIDGKVAEHKKRIEALTKKRNAAAEELDNKAMLEATDEIADLKAEVKLLEAEKQGHIRQNERARQASHERAVDASRDRVFSQFPAFAQEGSIERLALDGYIERALRDPNRRRDFADPKWPEKLAAEVATKYGIKSKDAAGAAPAPTPPATPPKPTATLPTRTPQQVSQQATGARMLTGADGQPAAPSQLTREEILAKVRNDPEARRSLFRIIPSKPGSSR